MSPRFNLLKNKIFLFFLIIGPGLVVMLADSDVGSLVTAAQSGAVWGYKLIIVQLLLIPVLYLTQELTVRLGVITGKGHGELIKKHFGSFWAWVSVSTLMICCLGAIITEMSGIASVGILFGIPIWLSMLLTLGFLIWLVWSRSYFSVERIALAIGAFELIYLFVACQAHPSVDEILYSFKSLPLHNPSYLYLSAANIGAVIMPWMIFYQQSAIVDKGLKSRHLKVARLETFLGAIATQAIMIAVILVTGTTLGKTNPGASLTNVADISNALLPYLGIGWGKVLFALGMLGAALIATIVVSLAAAWGVGEMMGYKRSLQDHPKNVPWFYAIYFLGVLVGAIVVVSGAHLVRLNIAVEVMNALLLPLVLWFLFRLAQCALPEAYRLRGWSAWLAGSALFITSAFVIVAGVLGIFF